MPYWFRNRKIKRNNINIEKQDLNIENSDINIEEQNIYVENTLKVTKKQNPIIRLIKLLIWIFIISSIVIVNNYNNFKTDILTTQEHMVNISSWDSFAKLWNKIPELDNLSFKIYLKYNKPEYSLQEGIYKIESWENIEWILEALNNPIYEEISITLLEWWNIYDIDEYLTNKWLIDKWEYISYTQNKEKISELSNFYEYLDWKEDTLEWFLYPDTYKINIWDFKINKLVIKQLDNFEIKVYSEILEELSVNEISDLVNLASIVEKEEKSSDAKPTVAWILKKRLDNWWMIWADITVCYPHELTANECKLVISKYINEKSDYNTRTKKGLPKTAIWNPSFDTINATLNYNETNYWFYLHNVTSGKIYYAETNAQHESNKKYMY